MLLPQNSVKALIERRTLLWEKVGEVCGGGLGGGDHKSLNALFFFNILKPIRII